MRHSIIRLKTYTQVLKYTLFVCGSSLGNQHYCCRSYLRVYRHQSALPSHRFRRREEKVEVLRVHVQSHPSMQRGLTTMAQRGVFIVFEGCDRAGKTTQCKKLVDALNKRNVPTEFMNFPDRTTAIGQIINDYLQKKIHLPDKAVHLLFSANRWELEPKMREKLENGISLVVDRYSYSGVAFSAAKKDMDLQWCWNPEIGLLEPDAVFLLNLSEEAAAKRGGFGQERYENLHFQKQVKENFMAMKSSSWKVIDADRSLEDLHLEIMDLFNKVHKTSHGTPFKTFASISRNEHFSFMKEKTVLNEKENVPMA